MDNLTAVTTHTGAKTFLSNGLASTTLILNQVPNLSEAWNSITEAAYKFAEHRTLMGIIRSNVDTLSTGVVRIFDLRRCHESVDDDGKAEIMNRIRPEPSRLHGLLTTTKSKIDELKIRLNGTRKSLMHQRRHQRTNMLESAVHLMTNFLQYFVGEESASTTLKVVQGLIFGLVVANGAMYWIAGEELAKPRQMNVEILIIENKVQELRNEIVEMEKWMELNGQM